jgi:hypothetical protein
MLVLGLIGIFLIYYGKNVKDTHLYKDGYRTKFMITIRNLRKMNQDEIMYILGGYTLMFSGIILIIGSFKGYLSNMS